ncbi:MAG: hypothetical protein Q9159_003003 [Coniocarpon cinnabarinum]
MVLSVMWNSGDLDLIESTQGNVVVTIDMHDIIEKDHEAPALTMLKFSQNCLETGRSYARDMDTTDSLVDDWASSLPMNGDDDSEDFQQSSRDPSLKHVVDSLPKRLTLMDVEASLPPLAPLSFRMEVRLDNRNERGIFLTQRKVDSLFDPKSITATSADLIITAWAGGECRVALPSLARRQSSQLDLHPGELIRHATNGSAHSFISMSSASQLALQVVHLDTIRQCDYHFPLLSTLALHLETVATYIIHAISAIRSAYKKATELPKRFITSVRSFLEEDNEHTASHGKPDLHAALYHTAATGDFHPVLRDWLVDTLREQNLRRWDTDVTTELNEITQIATECLFPALDRASVLTSRLRALSRKDPPLPLWTIDEQKLSRILTDIDLIRLVATHVVKYTADELHLFGTFSAWLSQQIIIASADSPDSQSALEAAEKAAALNQSDLLEYVTGPLLKSHLRYFLTRSDWEVRKAPRTEKLQQKWPMMVTVLEGHRNRCFQPKEGAEGMPGGRVEGANLLWQGLMMEDGVSAALDVPWRALMEGVRKREPLELGQGVLQDVTMTEGRADKAETLVLTLEGQGRDLVLTRVRHSVHFDGEEGPLKAERHHLGMPDRSTITAARFITARTIIASVSKDKEHRFGVCRVSPPSLDTSSPSHHTWKFPEGQDAENEDMGEHWDCRLDDEARRMDGKGEAKALVAGFAGEDVVHVLRVGLGMTWEEV